MFQKQGGTLIDRKEDETVESVDYSEVRELYKDLTQMLIKYHWTISTMESMTGGQIASLITDVEGASSVLKGAFVTYSDHAKVQQGVPRTILEQYGVYSEETARAMAKACARQYQADFGVGVTGCAGNPDPVHQDGVPGQVYFAIWSQESVQSGGFQIPLFHTRLDHKMYVAGMIAQTIKKILKEKEDGRIISCH